MRIKETARVLLLLGGSAAACDARGGAANHDTTANGVQLDNPTGDCSAANSGERFGYHVPAEGDVWLPDCKNPLEEEYYRVFAESEASAYVIPRADGSPYLLAVCADANHELYELAQRHTLCGEPDVELVNAMKPKDALALAHFLHQRLVFTPTPNGVTPSAMPSDILAACESDAHFRSGPMKERCDFEIDAAKSGQRNEIGWSENEAQAKALSSKLNSMYGIEGPDLCTRVATVARESLEEVIRGTSKACVTDEDCGLVLRSSACHASCEAVTAVSEQAKVQVAKDEISAGTCQAFADAACPEPLVPPCLPLQVRCSDNICIEQ